MAHAVQKRILIIGGVIVAACLLSVVAAVGWAWYKIHQDLSQAPPHASASLVPNVPTSSLAINVSLPLQRIVAQAEAAAPQTFSGSGNGPDVCLKKPAKVCTGTRYDFQATRGPITVGPGPDSSVRIAVPLKVTGHGAFRGDGAKLLHLPPRSFDLSTDAYADVSLAMQPDWCPRVHVSTNFSRLQAQVEIAAHTSVDLGDAIKDSVQQKLQALGEQAAGALKCDDIRRQMQDAWVARTFPFRLPGDPRPLWVNVDPVSLGFSGVKVAGSALSLLLSLGARVFVSDTSIPTGTRPLPAWTAVPLAHGGVQLSIPLRISYQGLDDHLQALLARTPLTFATIRGPAKILADKLNIYPSNDRLVVGVHVSATFPDSFFDTGGWLYLTARPILSADGKAVHLSQIDYSKLADNDLARMLTGFVDQQVRSHLATVGQFDLSDSISRATDLVKTGLAGQGGRMSFDVGDASIKLGRIVLGEDALFVEGLFTSGADVVLGAG